MSIYITIYMVIAVVVFIATSLAFKKTCDKCSDSSFFFLIGNSLLWGIIIPLSLVVFGVSYLCEKWQGWVNK